MEGVISVIIPVYNVARYLHACLDSVLSQDYSKLEIILIDDGSTDTSGKICDEYAARDSRIRVLHQANAGAAAAKNAGLRVATGEYLSFVDSDDFLEPGAYSHMIRLLKVTDSDVVQCAYRNVFTDRIEDRCAHIKHGTLAAQSYLALFTKEWTCGLMVDKLYRRSIFHGIFFEEGRRIDDEYFTYQGIMNASQVVQDDRIVYNYRMRRSSIMRSPESQTQILMDRIDYTAKRRSNVIARFPALRENYDRHFLDAMVYLSRDPHTTTQSLDLIRQQLAAYFRESGHTKADILLIPALLKLRLGLIAPPTSQSQPEQAENDNLFA